MKDYRYIQTWAALLLFCCPTSASAAVVAPQKFESQQLTPTAPKAGARVGQAALPCPPVVATMDPGKPPAGGGGGVVGILPNVATANLGYAGPTPSITAVANAIAFRAKSLTTQITIRAGLNLANPVMISIQYSSPAAQYRTNPVAYDCNGHRLMYNDPISGPNNTPGHAVWGKPRQMTVNVTLSEARPGGTPYVFTVPFKVNLDPLFDVSLTPLRFKLNTSCESFYRGDADIHFWWYAPDAAKPRERAFQASKGSTVTINEFAWARQEASGSANLMFPSFSFYEKDWNLTSPLQYDIPKPSVKLLPSTGGFVGRTIKDSSGQKNCAADVAFDVRSQVRQYTSL